MSEICASCGQVDEATKLHKIENGTANWLIDNNIIDQFLNVNPVFTSMFKFLTVPRRCGAPENWTRISYDPHPHKSPTRDRWTEPLSG